MSIFIATPCLVINMSHSACDCDLTSELVIYMTDKISVCKEWDEN